VISLRRLKPAATSHLQIFFEESLNLGDNSLLRDGLKIKKKVVCQEKKALLLPIQIVYNLPKSWAV
jgi:hypothetical protein